MISGRDAFPVPLAGKPRERGFFGSVPARMAVLRDVKEMRHATLGRQAITPSVRALTSGEARQVATES